MSSQTIFLTAGATSKTVDVTLVQKAAATSPGDPITGLAYNTASLTAYYRLGATGTLTSITLATQTVGGAFSSGGFVEVSSTNAPGQYRFDIPNACIATAGFCTITFNGAANMATHTINVIVTAVDLYATGGRIPADVTYWNGSVLTSGTGSVPEFGIIDRGTAQSATGTTLVLRSAAAFSDSELIGATIVIVSATAGAGQRRIITAYTGSTDTATVDTWTTTPTGTIVYAIFGSPPASTGLPVPSNMTQILGTAVSTPATAGILDVNVKNIDNDAASASGTVTFPNATLASTTNITAGTITTATNVTTVNGLAANVITAAATAADFTTEVASGLPTLTQINTTRYLKNTASQKVYFTLVDSTDHVTRKTGITVTAQRSLDGAAFGSATGTVTEVGNGVYYHSTSTADINADDVVFRFTGTACDPVELHIVTAS